MLRTESSGLDFNGSERTRKDATVLSRQPVAGMPLTGSLAPEKSIASRQEEMRKSAPTGSKGFLSVLQDRFKIPSITDMGVAASAGLAGAAIASHFGIHPMVGLGAAMLPFAVGMSGGDGPPVEDEGITPPDPAEAGGSTPSPHSPEAEGYEAPDLSHIDMGQGDEVGLTRVPDGTSEVGSPIPSMPPRPRDFHGGRGYSDPADDDARSSSRSGGYTRVDDEPVPGGSVHMPAGRMWNFLVGCGMPIVILLGAASIVGHNAGSLLKWTLVHMKVMRPPNPIVDSRPAPFSLNPSKAPSVVEKKDGGGYHVRAPNRAVEAEKQHKVTLTSQDHLQFARIGEALNKLRRAGNLDPSSPAAKNVAEQLKKVQAEGKMQELEKALEDDFGTACVDLAHKILGSGK